MMVYRHCTDIHSAHVHGYRCVCVYPNRVAEAVEYLKGTGIPVASVAAGFPAGQTSMK